ncbi:hypothetical protein [uncultured Microbulbifer sp.]|uniref:hypothetical protein n=1 Tax=uncultured Microbulbifer sp. TaxID=348147 RepID=UPI002621F248|nr:hypothetical protein [uncultured Microbulbifer sp.]
MDSDKFELIKVLEAHKKTSQCPEVPRWQYRAEQSARIAAMIAFSAGHSVQESLTIRQSLIEQLTPGSS